MPELLVLCYALGVVFFGGRLLVGLFAARSLVRSGRPVKLSPDHVAQLGTIRVLKSARVRVPLTVGWLLPAIVLPRDWSSWDAAMLAAVLAHEQAHIRRRDPWVALAAQVNRTIYWFHPLSWFLARRLTALAEQACDDAVIESHGDRTAYARHLLAIAGRLAGQPRRLQPVGVAMAARPAVEERIEAILDDRRPLARRLTLIGSLALLAITVPLMLLAAGLRAEEGKSPDVRPTDTQSAGVESDGEATNSSTDIATEPQDVLSGRIVDDQGTPVTDAEVVLRDTQGQQYLTTKTDADGVYRFKKIEQPSEFALQVTSQRCVGFKNWKTLPRMNLTPESHVVRDFALPLACRIELLVVDEQAKPVRGARVYSASLADDTNGNTEGVTTDKSGQATIGGLTPSDTDYIFGVSHREYGFAKLIFKLNDPAVFPIVPIALAKGQGVTGTAICADGKPAAGWRIIAMPTWWHFGVTPQGELIASDGSFTLRHVVPGQYDVTISIPSGSTSTPRTVLASATLPPANGKLAVTLDYPSPQSLAAIAGKLRYTGGTLRRGFWIFASSTEGRSEGSVYVQPGQKEFRIDPVPPGKYNISVDTPEIEPVTLRNVIAPSDNLEIKIDVTGRPELRGMVIDANDGKPVTKYRARIEKLSTLRGPNYVQQPSWYDVEDHGGKFAIEVPGPGIYRVLVAADGFAWTRSADVNSDEDASRNIKLALAAGATLRGTVVNEQGDPIDGAKVIPLSKAVGVVKLPLALFLTENGAVETADGHYTIDQLLPGKETLKVSHPDYSYVIVDNIDVPAGGGTAKPITLKHGGTVEGHVYDAQGKPEANVTLHVREMGMGPGVFHGGSDEDTGRLATVVTDHNGYYQVQGLPEKLCYVRRAQEWNAWGMASQTILPKNGKVCTLDFGGQQEVKGRLLVNGEPLADTRVALADWPSYGRFKEFAQTDSDGSFVFWSPPPGKWGLFYAIDSQRDKWAKVQSVQITTDPNDLGTIDHTSVNLTVQVNGMPDDLTDKLSVSFQEYDSNSMYELAPPLQFANPMVFDHVSPGQYELIFARRDGVQFRFPVDVKAAQSVQTVTLSWPSTNAAISGRLGAIARTVPPWLKSKDGRVWVGLRGESGIWSRLKGDGGTYKVDNLPAGDYFVTDQFVRSPRPVVEFSLRAGENKTFDVTENVYSPSPKSRAMLVLRVFTPNGVPLTGFTADLKNSGADIKPGPVSGNSEVHFIGPDRQLPLDRWLPRLPNSKARCGTEAVDARRHVIRRRRSGDIHPADCSGNNDQLTPSHFNPLPAAMIKTPDIRAARTTMSVVIGANDAQAQAVDRVVDNRQRELAVDEINGQRDAD